MFYIRGNSYYFSDNGSIIFEIENKQINIKIKDIIYSFDKTNKSKAVVNVKENKVYYINLSNNLIELNVDEKGNYMKKIEKVSFNNLFQIINEHEYFICNIYDGTKILNISGYNYTLNNNDKIINYGIHYDVISKNWLFIIENHRGDFATYILDKNKIVFKSYIIKYNANLSNICYHNDVIYTPKDGLIKGYSYKKNVYKDFLCSVVNEDSKLIRENNKFTVINEKDIYQVG